MPDKDLQDDDFIERIQNEGEVILSVTWDSHAPGMGADAEFVYEYGNKFYLLSSSDESFGPYETLDSLLDEHELFWINSATQEIECRYLSSEGIFARSLVDDDIENGFIVRVNGQDWVYRGLSKFEPLGS